MEEKKLKHYKVTVLNPKGMKAMKQFQKKFSDRRARVIKTCDDPYSFIIKPVSEQLKHHFANFTDKDELDGLQLIESSLKANGANIIDFDAVAINGE